MSSFLGRELSSFSDLVRGFVGVGTSSGGGYLGLSYEELNSALRQHLTEVGAAELEHQLREACEVFLEFQAAHRAGPESQRPPGQAVRIILEEFILPAMLRGPSGADAIALTCFPAFGARDFYDADLIAELLVQRGPDLLNRRLLTVEQAQTVVFDLAYSEDTRSQLLALRVMPAIWAFLPAKVRLVRALDAIARVGSDEARLPAHRVLDELDQRSEREETDRLGRRVNVLGVVIGLVGVLLTAAQILR